MSFQPVLLVLALLLARGWARPPPLPVGAPPAGLRATTLHSSASSRPPPSCHLRAAVDAGQHVVPLNPWMVGQQFLNRLPCRQPVQHQRYTDPVALDARATGADRRVDRDSTSQRLPRNRQLLVDTCTPILLGVRRLALPCAPVLGGGQSERRRGRVASCDPHYCTQPPPTPGCRTPHCVVASALPELRVSRWNFGHGVGASPAASVITA